MQDHLEFGCELVAATPWLRDYARSQTDDPAAARSLVEKTLTQGWRDRCGFPEGADLRGWLRQKAVS